MDLANMHQRFLAVSPNARPTLRRLTSTSSSHAARRTSTFSDFLSDSSGSDDEADAIQRMQAHADDMLYMEDAFLMPSPNDLSRSGLHAAEAPDTTFRMSTVVTRPTVTRLTATGARRTTIIKVPAPADANFAQIDGVILDSDEEIEEEEEMSDNDSSFASSAGPSIDNSFYHASPRGSEGGGDDGSSFASSVPPRSDSFRMVSPRGSDGEEEEAIDHSFSMAMRDADDVYDNGRYDDEVDETEAREKAREVEEEEDERRLSEEPVVRTRASVASAASSANSAGHSFASSSGPFFVESVRGSVDSVAPVMDLPASPMLSFVGGSAPRISALSAASEFLGSSSVDLAFRASGDIIQQNSTQAPAALLPPMPTLGIRVVDHTQQAPPSQTAQSQQHGSALSFDQTLPDVRMTLSRGGSGDIRASASSSSSPSSSSSFSSGGSSMNDMSFSSNIDESFTEQIRHSSEDDVSFVLMSESTVRHSSEDDISFVLTKDGAEKSRHSSDDNISFVLSKDEKSTPALPPSKSILSASPPSTTFFVDASFKLSADNSSTDPRGVRSFKAVPASTMKVPTVQGDGAGQSVTSMPSVNDDAPSAPLATPPASFSRPLPPARGGIRRGLPQKSTQSNENSTQLPPALLISVIAPATASPPGPSGINNSIASSRASDVRLDFTGVYMGEELPNSQRSGTAFVDVEHFQKSAEDKAADMANPSSKAPDAYQGAQSLGPPAMRRGVSAQEVSERKVEEFFRKTYGKKADEDDEDDPLFILNSGTFRGRSRTVASRNGGMGNGAAMLSSLPSTRSRRSSTSAMMLMDLKHVKSGQRIEDLLRANEEETKDDDEDLIDPMILSRNRTLSRPSARFDVNEDLLEEYFPGRPSTASAMALASRHPAPPRPEKPPLTPLTFSVESDGDGSSLNDSDVSISDSRESESSNVIQRNLTLSLASGSKSRSPAESNQLSSPNEIPMPPSYMLSPEHYNEDRASSSLGSFSTSSSQRENSSSKAPTAAANALPTLSVTTKTVSRAAFDPAASSSKLSQSGPTASPFTGSSMLRSPNPMASSTGVRDVAPGFRWHPELSQSHQQPITKSSQDTSSSGEDMNIKESIWHMAGGLSIGSGRPSMAVSVGNQLHRVSTTFKNSFQKARARFFSPPQRNGSVDFTSPKSECSAPPPLPRGFDDRRFYSRLGNIECGDAMIVVNRAARTNPEKEAELQRVRKTRAIMLLLGALFGIVIGMMFIHIESVASYFKPVVNPVTGDLTMPVAIKWLLLPGSLFLRSWNCVVMPLLFCHVVNGVAELAMTQKVKKALSFRAIGCMLATSLLTTLEGIGLMLIYHSLGLFAGKQTTMLAQTASLKASVGIVDRVSGMAAMMCASDEKYLQVSASGRLWRCSNETVPLPVEKGIVFEGPSWFGSSSAVFAFANVKSGVAATSTSASTYYPSVQPKALTLIMELSSQLVPNNVVDSFSKSLALSVVSVGLLVGLVCGLRAWQRSIAAQHQLQQSQSQPPAITELAESVLMKPHPVLGVVVEFQNLLEWIADVVQALAPVGAASILAGHIVLHRDEWFAVTGPVVSLIVGVCLAAVVHILLIAPLVLKLASGVNAWRSLPAFLPAMGLSFCTGNVVLSVPVLAHGYASAQVVTKSMSQVGTAMSTAVLRSANGLYYPLLLLFLAETMAKQPLTLSFQAVFLLSLVSLPGCFLAIAPGPRLGLPDVAASPHLRVVLMLFHVWSGVSLSGSVSTLPLLVVADVVLSHVVAMVNTHDHVLFTRLLGDHCAELCVASPSIDDMVGVGASPVYL